MKYVSKIKRETWFEILFLFCLFLFYAMWARIQPFNASPDEGMRYTVVKYIYDYGTLPRGDDPMILDPTWGLSYAYSPILDYMAAALLMRIVSVVTTAPFVLLFAARMVSVLCGVGTAFFALRIGKKIFDKQKAWFFTFFITLLPGAVFINTYVNTDAMAMMSTAMIVYAWILGMENGWKKRNCVFLAGGIGLCALSYYNAYGFILCSILLFGITLLMECKRKGEWQFFLKRGALVTLLVLLFIGWWFGRNYVIYDGDFFGRTASAISAEKYAMPGFKPSDKVTPMSTGMTMYEMLTQSFSTTTIPWIELVSRSFIGRFGSLDICIPAPLENVYLDFIKFGLFLVMIHPIKTFALVDKKGIRKEGIFHWCMLIALIIPNILNAWYSYSSDYQPQGRYSLPMLVPLAYFLVIGYGNLFDVAVEKLQNRKCIYVGITIVLAVVSIYVYLEVFWPAYMKEGFSILTLLAGPA